MVFLSKTRHLLQVHESGGSRRNRSMGVAWWLLLGLVVLCGRFHCASGAGAAHVISITIRPADHSDNNNDAVEDNNSKEPQDRKENITTAATTTTTTTPIETEKQDEEGACELVTLEMTTPQPIQFQLLCDEESIWNYPPPTSSSSSLQSSSSFGFLSLTACIDPAACCEFTIGKDKTTSSNGSNKGVTSKINVEKEGMRIFASDRAFPFDSFTRMFGASCTEDSYADDDDEDEETTVIQEEDGSSTVSECTANDETPVRLAITLDDHPEQQGWYLMCQPQNTTANYDDDNNDNDIVTLWDMPVGSLTNASANATIQQEACISSTHKCVFSIVDSQGDGISGGGYSLLFGNEMIGGYISQEEFDELSYCVGHACQTLPGQPHLDNNDKDVNLGVENPPNQQNVAGNIHDEYDEEDAKEEDAVSIAVVIVALVVCGAMCCCLVRFRSHRSLPVEPNDGPANKTEHKGDDDDDQTVDTDNEFIIVDEEFIL